MQGILARRKDGDFSQPLNNEGIHNMSQRFEFLGTIARICEIQEFRNNFRKRIVVLSDDDAKFPQEIAFQFKGRNLDLADRLREGDKCRVEFAIEAREWNGKRYTDLVATDILPTDQRQAAPRREPEQAEMFPAEPVSPAPPVPPSQFEAEVANELDNLPF